MKNIFTLIGLLYGVICFGQQQKIEKPEYVIIANNQIITEAKLGEYAQNGYIKAMNKGVSQEYRDELATQFGDKIGDRAFIISIDLFTEEQRIENQNKANTIPKQTKVDFDEGLLLNVNDVAKDFTVQMINGESVKLSDLKGKVVFLNFWATWCAPCLIEFHEIPEKILEPFKNDDFVFLSISRGETKEKVSKKMLQLQDKGIDFNVGIDQDKNIWNQYATKYIPKNFIIDKDGVIRFISTGNYENSVDTIAKEIKKLLKD
ncbi:TlpA disulfide reductase family protein [Formosa sp. L2A11]|uniref:TlpA family protein disulfide reductase n=1 Tax=Formosa sp. L2A11 TaxID=2686363 RepID=UPI00131BDA3F|nr:TlpA disulfide reductase family protein [Formosa sp. L2A11]